MNNICKNIFKAVHEGKWLSIVYRNQNKETTKYWINIKGIDPIKKMLLVDGLHLFQYTLREMNIFIDSIKKAEIIDGSYCEINKALVDDISLNPAKYRNIFHNAANFKILNYLSDCHKLDTTPYKSNYDLIKYFDRDCLISGSFKLSDVQFKEIISKFQKKATDKQGKKRIEQLAVNVLSINTKQGLYVLAHKRLYLDVQNRELKAGDSTTISMEFTVEGTKQTIRQYLDEEDYHLLDDFEKNQEIIKDKITRSNPKVFVDDMPYIIAMGYDILINLDKEI